jgi:hypothetical protein
MTRTEKLLAELIALPSVTPPFCRRAIGGIGFRFARTFAPPNAK